MGRFLDLLLVLTRQRLRLAKVAHGHGGHLGAWGHRLLVAKGGPTLCHLLVGLLRQACRNGPRETVRDDYFAVVGAVRRMLVETEPRFEGLTRTAHLPVDCPAVGAGAIVKRGAEYLHHVA